MTQPPSSSTRWSSLPLVLLALAVLAYGAYFTFLTVTRYNAFEARALDMGNLNQAIWNTAHGNWFHLTNQPGIDNRLSLHVEPIIVPLALLYRIWPDPRFLLTIQAAVVALGALPVFALARFRLRNDWLALIFAAAFLLHPSIQAANWLEFHPVTLAPTFLLAAFYFLAREEDGRFALFAVLAASCKEEIALLVFMMGFYAFVRWQRRRLGLVTMILSLSWALFAVLVVQNLFASGNIHWERYGYLGEEPGEILVTMLTQPGLVLAQLREAETLTYLMGLMLPVAFLSLAGLDLFLMALPSLAINLLANFPPMHQVDTLIYAAPIMPFVLISGIYGAERVIGWSGRHMRGSGSAAPRGALVAVGGAVMAGSIAGQLLGGYLPGGGNFRLYPVTDHHRAVQAVIEQIPPDAKVSAQDKLDPHVSGRETVYIFPRIDDADMIFVDTSGPAWPQHPSDLYTMIGTLLDQEWGVAAGQDGYLLLARNEENKSIPPAFYSRWQTAPPAEDRSAVTDVRVDFDGQLRLVGYRVGNDQHGELVTTLYWDALQPPADDWHFYIAYLHDDGTVLHDSVFYPPPAALWYPTSLWTPGKTVAVTTLPWALDADEFTLAVGLYQGENGWSDGDRAAITDHDARLVTLEGNTLARLGRFSRTNRHGWAPLTAKAPEKTQTVDAVFGEQLTLTGVALEQTTLRPGQDLDVVLTWQADTAPPLDYSLFIHVVDAEGGKIAQWDGQPSDRLGPRPMTGWRAGEQIVQRQTLSIPDETAPGDYQVILGVYDWQSGVRLPVALTGSPAGDHAVLGALTIR